MAWVLVDHQTAHGPTTDQASVTLNTAGAGLYVLAASFYGGSPTTANISDSMNNTWVAGARRSLGGGGNNGQFFWAYNTSNYTTHVFSLTTLGVPIYASITVWAFSGNDTTNPFDQEVFTTNAGAVATMSPGSLTPAQNDTMLLTLLGGITGAYATTPTIDSGFTVDGFDAFTSSVNVGLATAHYNQPVAAAINPTWTVVTPDTIGALQIAFKPGTGGSGIGTPPAAPTAAFGGTDTITQGNWKGVYGADGEVMTLHVDNHPSYVVFWVSGHEYAWEDPSSDGRALQYAAVGSSQRIASTWYDGSAVVIDINLTDGLPHQVALYLLDWENAPARAERVDIRDASLNTLLDTQSVSGFSAGQYWWWTLTGHVRIVVAATTGPNAVVSGVFFDPSGASPSLFAPSRGSIVMPI